MRNLPVLLQKSVGSVLLLSVASACSIFQTDEAPPAGYIKEPEKLSPWPERAAFLQKIWFADREKLYSTRSRFKKICFRPTRTDFLMKRGWWSELNSVDSEGYQQSVNDFARYLDQALADAVNNDPQHRFELTTEPDASTVVYEFALTELVLTKVHMNIAGTALGALIPGGGLVSASAKGSVAVEVAAYDGADSALLLTWIDRKVDQESLFSFRDFSQLGHQRRVADEWAHDLVEVWNTPATHKVEGLSSFTLSPF